MDSYFGGFFSMNQITIIVVFDAQHAVLDLGLYLVLLELLKTLNLNMFILLFLQLYFYLQLKLNLNILQLHLMLVVQPLELLQLHFCFQLPRVFQQNSRETVTIKKCLV